MWGGKPVVFRRAEFKLKDGRNALLYTPSAENAEEMLHFIIKASGETDFLMKLPEEYADFTLEQEKAFINEAYDDPGRMMIACSVDGKLAGNCQISFRSGLKDRHRASVAIALLQEFWGLGIGTRMFREMFEIAREREGVRQIELDFVEGNVRARALYEKMGFRITGLKPDAIRLKDGCFVNEYMMVKTL